ncbi:MAG: hypothetical protein KGD59_04980 [Candidatus Heimdallarchaeota archaeon]|nr:hypothetical protein [Candidatus Heimdallarchaeota archaeon]MBY8993882.1 hypothetical protein [Candidatus Heimdallarchaeota archaeon]
MIKKFHKSKSTLIREDAERIIREIINDESIDENSKWGFKLDLCFLLLHEYIDTGKSELVDEIETITSNLLTDLKFYDEVIPRIGILSYRLFALLIQAKIHGDKKKLEEIQDLLSKTEKFAGVKGNKLLLKYLEENREYYTSLTDELVEIIEKYVIST